MTKEQYRQERIKAKQKQERAELDFFEFLLNPLYGSMLNADELAFRLLAQKRGIIRYKNGHSVGTFKLDDESASIRQSKLLSVKKFRKS